MFGIPKAKGIWGRTVEGEGQDQIYTQRVHRWPTGDGWGRMEVARPVGRLWQSPYSLALRYGTSGIQRPWWPWDSQNHSTTLALKDHRLLSGLHSTGHHSLLCFSSQHLFAHNKGVLFNRRDSHTSVLSV